MCDCGAIVTEGRREGTRGLFFLLVLLSCSLVPSLSAQWSLATREPVDVWLHGYALVHDDSSAVPLYRRGYRADVAAAKGAASVVTDLDVNVDKLRETMRAVPSLMGGQFLALEFVTWGDMRSAIQLWLDTEGDPRRLRTPDDLNRAGKVAAYFPDARSRDWLRLFVLGLDDEYTKYFRATWATEQAARAATLGAAQRIWRDSLYPSLRTFLGNSQLGGGTIVPSFVLGGEGRTVTPSRATNVITTGLPASDTAAWGIAYVFVHEAASTVAAAAVRDHTTPAQQRSGEAEAYSAVALVRGGALLLEKAMPNKVEDYMRFYLTAAGKPVAGEVRAAFAATFALPAPMLAGIKAQIDIVWGGI